MTFTPKLIALDIDGTVLVPEPENGYSVDEVTPAVREAIDRAYEAGCHVVLASGRAPLSMSVVLRHLDMPRDPATHVLGVASNGAVTFSFPPLKVVSEVTFDAREAVKAVLEHVPGAAVAVEEHGVGYRVNRHFPEGELDGEMILTPIEEMIAREVSRVIIRDPDSTSEDFVTLAHRLGLQGTNYFIGWTAWLDLAPEGVSKASGLEEVAAQLGVDAADVLAIGDGRNDIEMLQWAGRGVAMGQAPDEVKAAADGVTDTVYNDGAALEINRWF
ncbi:MAG TPA: HAD family hydrolase [Nocardioidaceae bacterium]|nr:HAD family hydrolase [Nocardioidaceae bacterium]HSE72737.1 HAD family hydrolase [Nocardioidaceae bacterium]